MPMMIKVDQLQGLQVYGLKLIKEIDRGSFGVVYEAISIKNDKKYAVKVQPNNTKNPQLNFQFDLYKYLAHSVKKYKLAQLCFPQIYAIFSDNHYTFMVIELLGKNLYQLFKEEKSIFDQRMAYIYATKMLITIHLLHLANIVYRDIKPENFLLRTGQLNSLVLVDFGLCKKEAKKKQRQKHSSNRTLIGTSRYASINAHEGKQVTKADDIESLCYVIIYLCKGRLPWQGIKRKSQSAKNSQVLKMKKSISVEQLCQGLPQGIHVLASYIRNLPKGQQLNYELLTICFREAQKQISGLEKNKDQEGDSLVKKQVSLKQEEKASSLTPVKIKNELPVEKSSQGSSMNASQSTKKGKKATKRPLVKRQFLIKEEDPNDQISQPSDSDPDDHPSSKFALQ